ncbi:unnamed protein product [Mytilus coruscus]|uniref:Uncharacterized protein n=1 Tax=Mytilus coruscus TaxID=42192 RepID=A0A6J8EJH6_MYTCO|nr:unnamed protein product [Mytilus coruscus]
MSSEQECWKRLSEFNVNRETVVALLKDENYTDGWSLEKLKSPIWKEFYFWDAVIKVVEEEEEMSIKENLLIAFKNFDILITSVSSFVRKIRNRMALILKRIDVTLGYDVVFGNENFSEVGPYCMKYGITLEWLKNPSKLEGILNLPIGLIVELRKLRLRHNFTFKDFSVWIKLMLGLDYCPDVGFLRRQMESFYKRQLALSKNSKIDQDMYLDSIYVPPKTKYIATGKNEGEGLQQRRPCLNTVDGEKCKYTDDVREVYATLLSMNICVKNIENVIKTVLEKLGGLKVERLPNKTFAEYMMVEAKALAQIQAAELQKLC